MNSHGISNYTLSLSEAVVLFIENKILSGELVTGDKINEYAISTELNISRAPIREAISELQVAGLIEHHPRKSGLVSVLTKEDINEIFDIRISLEKDIIRIILTNGLMTQEHISHLRRLAKEMLETSGNYNHLSDLYQMNKMDMDFHTYLWKLSKSPRRARMLHNMFMQLVIAINQHNEAFGKIEEKASEHMTYIDALAHGDIEETQKILEKHIDVYRNELYKYIR